MGAGEHRLLRFFEYAHLPKPLQEVSEPYKALAEAIVTVCTNDPAEQTTALRKLLESKDAAVRALLPVPT